MIFIIRWRHIISYIFIVYSKILASPWECLNSYELQSVLNNSTLSLKHLTAPRSQEIVQRID